MLRWTFLESLFVNSPKWKGGRDHGLGGWWIFIHRPPCGLVAELNYQVVQNRKEKKTNRDLQDIASVRPRAIASIDSLKKSRTLFTQQDMTSVLAFVSVARARNKSIWQLLSCENELFPLLISHDKSLQSARKNLPILIVSKVRVVLSVSLYRHLLLQNRSPPQPRLMQGDRLITSESQYDFHCWLLDRSSFEKKRSFTRETPFRLSEFNEDTSSLNEAKLLLRSSELQMVHEHVVNRCSMQVHRSTANDYLAWQKRQKINGWWTQGVRWFVSCEPCVRLVYLVDCEFIFDGLKNLGCSNSCLTANNTTSTATNIIRLLVALRAIAIAGFTGFCEWRSCQRA